MDNCDHSTRHLSWSDMKIKQEALGTPIVLTPCKPKTPQSLLRNSSRRCTSRRCHVCHYRGGDKRTISQREPDGMQFTRHQITSVSYSMNTSLLKAISQGQLPRLAEIELGSVYQVLKKLNQGRRVQPGTDKQSYLRPH